MNKLQNWINARNADPKEVMNALQEYGVVSDNCINPSDVGNDMQAMKWVACNHKLIKTNDNIKSAG